MPVKSFRPTTPTRRFQTVVSREEITKQKPEKSLVKGKPATGGRSSTGRISSRFRGGGHKKAYREIDFKPGMVPVLEDGEEITQLNPAQPTASFPDSLTMLMRLTGLTLGMPLELVLLDFSRPSFSASSATAAACRSVISSAKRCTVGLMAAR